MNGTEMAVLEALRDPEGIIAYTYSHPWTGEAVIERLITMGHPGEPNRHYYLNLAEVLLNARANGMAAFRSEQKRACRA